jgi:single stranded DNA-binding protein
MAHFALIVLTGHIGRDAELTYLSTGTAVLKFSLAVNTGSKDKQTLSWYSVAFFGSRAEKLAPWLTKGKGVIVSGEPTIRQWTSQAGKQGTSVEVRANDIIFLQSPSSGVSSSNSEDSNNASVSQQTLNDNSEVPF